MTSVSGQLQQKSVIASITTTQATYKYIRPLQHRLSHPTLGLLSNLLAVRAVHVLLHEELSRQRRQLPLHHHRHVSLHRSLRSRVAVVFLLHFRQERQYEDSHGEVGANQCDRIGRFLKVLGDKLSCKSYPHIG